MHPLVRSRTEAGASTVNTARREPLLPCAVPLARVVTAGAHQHPRPAVLCAQLPAAMFPKTDDWLVSETSIRRYPPAQIADNYQPDNHPDWSSGLTPNNRRQPQCERAARL